MKPRQPPPGHTIPRRPRPPAIAAGWSGAVACLLLALLMLSVAVRAQETIDLGEPFVTWQQTAQAAAGMLDRQNAPIATLEQLRARIAAQREQMFELGRIESIEARAIRAQLETLGPPPAEGETEPTELSERRAALNRSLAVALAPTRAAREAYERANVLVAELDTVIRRATARELLARSPSPLNPDAWREAGTELRSYREAVAAEIDRWLSDPERLASFRAPLPLMAVLAIAGLVAIFLGEPWATRRAMRAATTARTPGRRQVMVLLGFVARFGLPVLGALALLVVPSLANLDLDSAATLRSALPGMVLFLISAHVLARAIFSHPLPNGFAPTTASLASRPAYLLAIGLGLFLAAELALGAIQEDFRFSARAAAVLTTPVIVLGAILLFTFGGVLLRLVRKRAETADAATADDTGAAGGAWFLVARLLQLAGILSAVFLLLGYANLAREALVPVTLTLALLGFALWLFELITGLLEGLTAGPETTTAERQALLPVLLAMLIGLAALPVLALIWGARASDIAEVWRLMTDGVPIGETRISLSVVLILIVAFTLGLVATRWLQRLLRVTVLPRTRLDIGARTSLVTGVGYVGLTLSALIAISTAGIDLSSLAFVAGALSIGIGFGLQNIVQNFVSGIILLIERPIKEGDWIEVSGHAGLVRKISVRSTRIETFDRHDVIVPNADLISGTVKNMTLSSQIGRLIVPVGIAYGSDLEATKAILLDAAKGHPMVLGFPEPLVFFMGLGDSSLDFELRCYLGDITKTLLTRSDLLYEIYVALGDAGIEIPFPQRDLHIRDHTTQRVAEARPDG